jgi:hypothetical protein
MHTRASLSSSPSSSLPRPAPRVWRRTMHEFNPGGTSATSAFWTEGCTPRGQLAPQLSDHALGHRRRRQPGDAALRFAGADHSTVPLGRDRADDLGDRGGPLDGRVKHAPMRALRGLARRRTRRAGDAPRFDETADDVSAPSSAPSAAYSRSAAAESSSSCRSMPARNTCRSITHRSLPTKQDTHRSRPCPTLRPPAVRGAGSLQHSACNGCRARNDLINKPERLGSASLARIS